MEETEQPPVADTPPPAMTVVQEISSRVPRVSFKNLPAVRTAMTVAGFATLLNVMPLLGILFVLWSLAAGFAAVMLYSRRTGERLDWRAGAKLGWMTALFEFVIFTILQTIVVMREGGEVIRQQFQKMSSADPNYAQVMALLQNPYATAAILVFSLIFVFALFVASGMAGGALGAKTLARD